MNCQFNDRPCWKMAKSKFGYDSSFFIFPQKLPMFVTVKEMVKAEQRAIKQLLIPGTTLMYNAGKSVVDYILDHYPKLGNVGVAAGFGNNGGDGFVTALLLSEKSKNVRVFSLGKPESFSHDAQHFLSICKKRNIDIVFPENIKDACAVANDYKNCDLIVDALLGTGLNGPVGEPVASVILNIPKDVPIVSVDIPSGLNGTTGEAGDACIRARQTVTFARPKIGMKNKSEYTGDLIVTDIGIPEICFDDKKWYDLTHQKL